MGRRETQSRQTHKPNKDGPRLRFLRRPRMRLLRFQGQRLQWHSITMIRRRINKLKKTFNIHFLIYKRIKQEYQRFPHFLIKVFKG